MEEEGRSRRSLHYTQDDLGTQTLLTTSVVTSRLELMLKTLVSAGAAGPAGGVVGSKLAVPVAQEVGVVLNDTAIRGIDGGNVQSLLCSMVSTTALGMIPL